MRLPPAARTHAETQIQTQHRADRPRYLDRAARTCNSASPALLCRIRPVPVPAPAPAPTVISVHTPDGPAHGARAWAPVSPAPRRLAHDVRARAHTSASPVPRTARPRSRPRSRCPPPSPSAHPRLQWWTPPCRNTVTDLAPSRHTSLRTRGCAVPAWDLAPRYRPARGVRARTLATLAPRTARPRPAPTAAAISVHVRAAAPVYNRAPDAGADLAPSRHTSLRARGCAVPAWDKPARGVRARTPASPAPPPLPQPSPSACARQRQCTPPRRMLVPTSRPRGIPLCARGEVPGLYVQLKPTNASLALRLGLSSTCAYLGAVYARVWSGSISTAYDVVRGSGKEGRGVACVAAAACTGISRRGGGGDCISGPREISYPARVQR
ncbi:hypothetical protein DFH08DRAFT_1050031 [Mycena albidolilacea]|uniref:Uncharacterized protein n=1 Tax=Mycena albidolilacea TaxID=1033008 RepID=A0AAD6Z748_9AGAR|nr:hypothetical protein DFH08DRAFT_1050031 [Mycena albidolilacea]